MLSRYKWNPDITFIELVYRDNAHSVTKREIVHKSLANDLIDDMDRASHLFVCQVNPVFNL
tara:strand:- start:1654 stop:1836 length:183 start_codon:yes stop_codon:yes gene_type:complete